VYPSALIFLRVLRRHAMVPHPNERVHRLPLVSQRGHLADIVDCDAMSRARINSLSGNGVADLCSCRGCTPGHPVVATFTNSSSGSLRWPASPELSQRTPQ
jgi:hypothetical protein